MSAKSKKPSAADLLKAQLSNVVTSEKRGGEAVAKKALEEEESPKKSPAIKDPKKEIKPTKKHSKVKPTGGHLEKITISLHEADLARLDEIDNALRKAKVPGRGIATSTLIKIAIAGFDVNSGKLLEILDLVKSQDRRKNRG